MSMVVASSACRMLATRMGGHCIQPIDAITEFPELAPSLDPRIERALTDVALISGFTDAQASHAWGRAH